MAKYTFEFKKKIVEDYLYNKGSYRYLAKKIWCCESSKYKKWVKSYERIGDKDLLCSTKNQKYTFGFKLLI